MKFRSATALIAILGLFDASATNAAPIERPQVADSADNNRDRSAKNAEDAVARYEKRFSAGGRDFHWQHGAVKELKSLNTEIAHTLLRNVALGEYPDTNDNLDAWAAQNLISCEPNEAWRLLKSSNTQVLNAALNSLRGQAVDPEFLEPLKACARHENLLDRKIAIHVLAEDPRNRYSAEALEAIHQALTDVAALPNVDELRPRAIAKQQFTFGEMEYQAYWSLLINLRVDDQVLRAFAKQQQGRGRDAVLIALAMRGDTSAHDDMIQLCGDKDAGRFRAWAAIALEKISVPADLQILQTLAKHDPLTRLDASCVEPNEQPRYPVRQAATSTILQIERSQKKKVAK